MLASIPTLLLALASLASSLSAGDEPTSEAEVSGAAGDADAPDPEPEASDEPALEAEGDAPPEGPATEEAETPAGADPPSAGTEEPPASEPASPETSAVSTVSTVDGLRPGGWALDHPREHYWVPNSWPVAQPCDFTLTPRRSCLVLSTDVFAGYRHDFVAGGSMGEFRVDRGEVGTGFVWKPHARIEGGAVVRLEAIRSAGPGSLMGIDGNSLIVRLLETYGHVAAHLGPIDLGARVGLVPERWIEQVQKVYDTRAVASIPSERAAFLDRSDVGATLTASGWKGLVELDLQVVNGEGRAQEELNPGKNTTAMLSVRPLRRRLPKGPLVLAVHGGYRDGSLGVASLRNHRGAVAIGVSSPWVYAGFEYAHALGYQARGDVTANALGAWASGHVLAPWLGLMGKLDRIQADLSDGDSVVLVATAGAFGDLFPYIDRNRRRLRLYVVYQYEGHGDAAGPLPGTPEALDTHRVMVQLQARGAIRAY
ncbi:MAG: hypothetical protein H6712_31685 [Myxococcales bacterium]|nr:hypothetical protein [Myxococcales bacterium]MCB9718454.1 hypothetical protein [Myxococcales bacterium]